MAQTKSFSLKSVYGFSVAATLIVLVLIYIYGGLAAIFPLLILAVLEMTFSFDNAVLNSQILAKLSKFWQQIFLTIGIAIAVFGVRLILPIVLVASTTGNSLRAVLDMALNHQEQYAYSLEQGYPIIAAFGGVFLLMIGLRFFGESRRVHWLTQIERPLGEFNQPWWVVGVGAIFSVATIYLYLAPGQQGPLKGAIFGVIAFVVIKGLSELLVRKKGAINNRTPSKGWHAFSLFLYLELLDASFSFDGVVAAFAISKDVIIIAAGLGIGALFVRSMTIHMLQQGTITKFRYLIHGAHYAVLMLGVLMLISIKVHTPEAVTGLAGICILTAAFYTSWKYEKSVK